jgi:putative PEP-CTERM system histidine kinase
VENISLILFLIGALAYVSAAVVVTRHRSKVLYPALTVATALGLAAWQGVLAWNAVAPLPGVALIGVELARSSMLLVFMHLLLRRAAGQGFTAGAFAASGLAAVALPALLIATGFFPGTGFGENFVAQRQWAGVFISVGLLIGLEQVVRNAGPPVTLVHYTCVALGFTVVYDLFLFSNSLNFEQLDVETWRARGGINAIAAAFISAMVARSRAARAISFSRNVVFYTASLTIAGIFLLAISVAGYAMRKPGGSWGTVLELMLSFSAGLLVVSMAISRPLRDRLRVYVSKNFFALRYDYRREWLHLIDELSAKSSDEHLYVRAIRVLADLYKCPGGVLWLRHEKHFSATASCRMRRPEGCDEPADSDYCRMLSEGWIFDLEATPPPGRALPRPPDWVPNVPDLALVIPLKVEDELIGFVGLQRSLGFSTLEWEDLDILKTAARQVASYIARFQSAEQLARARQFDTYHQLTAFIMHDLKNLIAQQELVVKNAARHKENPAFVKDAIDTIQNSVARMSTLLKKLQTPERTDPRAVSIQEVLIDATKKCQTLNPKPALRIAEPDLRVLSDRDHLVMVISHIIKNAQEATAQDGFVDVSLRRDGALAIVEVEDNGSGMDEEFLRHRLFNPFDSTKTGKGMGIGAYQAREFIRELGGDIRVVSKPGVGSTFTVSIPLAGAEAGLRFQGATT